MTGEKGRNSETTENQLLIEVQRLLEKEGQEGWKLAQETMLEDRTNNEKLDELMRYIMLESPPDYFRPALISFCSKAVGGTSDATIPIGASLVLFARAIGIHDDIIDQSKTKNQRTTVLGKFGRDLAIILTDILLFKGFTLLRKTLTLGVPTRRLVDVLDVIDKIWFEQSEAEVLEVHSRGKTNVTPQECLIKIQKRASELEAGARIGGILGNGSKQEIEALGRYGRKLGTASILRDELIDMLDFKTLRRRVRKEALPLSLIYALQNRDLRDRLIFIVSKQKLTTENLRELLRISYDVGGMEYVATYIEEIAQEACSDIALFEGKSVFKCLRLLIDSLPFQHAEWLPILRERTELARPCEETS